MSADDLPPVLTLSEVQQFLRLGYHSVRALVVTGRLRALRVGRAIRIPRAEVERLLGDPDFRTTEARQLADGPGGEGPSNGIGRR